MKYGSTADWKLPDNSNLKETKQIAKNMNRLLKTASLAIAVPLLAASCQGMGGHRNPNLAVDSDTIVITHPEEKLQSVPDTLTADSTATDTLQVTCPTATTTPKISY